MIKEKIYTSLSTHYRGHLGNISALYLAKGPVYALIKGKKT